MNDDRRLRRLADVVGASAFVLVDLPGLQSEPIVLGVDGGTLFTIIVDDDDDATFLVTHLVRTGAPRFESVGDAQRYVTSTSSRR